MDRKPALIIILTVILVGMLASAFSFQQVRSDPGKIVVPDNYSTIQGAINAAHSGDIIFVKNRTYNEHVVVNKVISLIGESVEATVIDGGGSGTVMNVTANNVIITGFTIRNSGIGWRDFGLALSEVRNCNISRNKITANNGHGIYLDTSLNNSISENNITENNWGGMWASDFSDNNSIIGNNITSNKGNGIWLDLSNYNSIIGNNIANNKDGLVFCGPSNNRIIGNNMTANSGDGIRLFYSAKNTIFHNNIVENQQQAYTFKSYGNIWDNDYPSGGNYWSNYTGADLSSGLFQNETGSDGIGDTLHSICANHTDRYPLMASFGSFKAGTWDNTTCSVDIFSNSTVSDFQLFFSPIPEIPPIVSFNVSGSEYTFGFCRVTIPSIIVENSWQGNYFVFVNGESVEFRNWTDAESAYIYFTYSHSEKEVVIVPEFVSIMILPLFMIATLFAVIVYKRKYSYVTAQE